MTHYIASDDTYRDLPGLDDYGSADAPNRYRFGRSQGNRVHARTALRRVSGYFKGMIEAIANAKLRRMERELELRGIRFDRANDSWVTRKSSTGASGDEAAPDRNGVQDTF
jgi:hypothetical protein